MAVRTALGARRVVLIRMLVLEQTVAVGIGSCLGAVLPLWAGRLVQSHLFELTPLDPRTWGLSTLTLLATATIGALVPSLRATRVDAATALRAE